MNGFRASQSVEAEANRVLLPYLLEQSNGRLVMTNKGTLARWLQESVGDVLLEKDEQMLAVELKAERAHTGNLFLEIWSNRNLDDRASHAERGSNPGWLMKSKADLLLYYFIDADILYSLDLLSVKRWMFGWRERPGLWGRGVLAPIQQLRDELPRNAMKTTSVRQREIEVAAA